MPEMPLDEPYRPDEEPEHSNREEVECKSMLAQIPSLPQRQDGCVDQLRDLYQVANKLGMHDAADIIREAMKMSS